MTKLLITGASGMLGGEILKQAGPDWNAVGACHRSPRSGMLQLDFNEPDAVTDAIVTGGFSHIVHCAAIRDPDFCLLHPEEADITNARGSQVIAQAVAQTHAVLCYISTDYVFDGTHPPYVESDPTCPINVYGKSKLAGEEAARALPEHLVVRIPALYRSTLGDAANVLTKFASQLKAGETLHLDSETVRHYTRTDDVAAAVLFLLERGQRGIIHVAADETLSKAEFARLAAVQLGYPPERVTDAPPPTSGDARPHNSKLDTALYRSLHGPHMFTPSQILPAALAASA